MSSRTVPHRVRTAVTLAVALAVVVATTLIGSASTPSRYQRIVHRTGLERISQSRLVSNGAAAEGDVGEKEGKFEIQEAAAQYAEPRMGPPGALLTAREDAAAIPTVDGTWVQVTNRPYDSDDPHYRDPFISNSGGGAGMVTGRASAVAVDGGQWVYIAGADGGLWRSRDGGSTWTPLTDDLPSLSSGAVAVNHHDHSVWYGTGESNTAFENYLGAGLFVSYDHGSSWDKVGGDELDGQMISSIVFDGHGHVIVGSSAGIMRRSLGAPPGQAWQLVSRPGTPGPYGFTFVNNVAVDPTSDGQHMVASIAWREGGTDYDGFYESWDAGVTWNRVPATGGINDNDIGRATFAFGSDGSLVGVVESIHKYFFSPETALMGVFVSHSGDVGGPWKKVASSKKLGNSPGSALGYGSGYSPGIQAWYNMIAGVSPKDPDSIYVGLEEVYQSTDGGRHWTTIGPYWNFGLPCGEEDIDDCPKTTHPDQHGIAFGQGRVWIANDGGLYSRGLHGNHWINNNADLRMLQYYYGGTGRVPGGVAYWGGMQDNGGSLLLPGADTMVSPFGGDGGDVIVDRNNANRNVSEYVELDMWLTKKAGRSDGSTFAWREITPACGAFTYTPDPCDPQPRFIAPFEADSQAPNSHWVAGGRYVWETHEGWKTHCSADACDWTISHDTGEASQVTALAVNGDTIYAGYCGFGCNPSDDFYAGIDTNYGGTWHTVAGPDVTNGGDLLPQRYVFGLTVDPNDDAHVFAMYSGYSRRWIPGGGVGHVFESMDGGDTWTDITGNLPDAPADDLVISGDTLVLSTDVGVFVADASDPSSWSRFGTGLPNAIPNDLTTTPGGAIVAVTHGRGMYRIAAP
jgi:hypothetical protein